MEKLQHLFNQLTQLIAAFTSTDQINPLIPYPSNSFELDPKFHIQQHSPTNPSNQRSTSSSILYKQCTGCGSTPRHRNHEGTCPAWGTACTACGKLNHIASVCQASHAEQLHRTDTALGMHIPKSQLCSVEQYIESLNTQGENRQLCEGEEMRYLVANPF